MRPARTPEVVRLRAAIQRIGRECKRTDAKWIALAPALWDAIQDAQDLVSEGPAQASAPPLDLRLKHRLVDSPAGSSSPEEE